MNYTIESAIWISSSDNKYSDSFRGPVIAANLLRRQQNLPANVPFSPGRRGGNYRGNYNKRGINRFPPSVLRRIFLAASHDDVLTRTRLRKVCRTWRILALGMSEMWTHVYVNGNRPWLLDQEFIGVIRSRAKLSRERQRQKAVVDPGPAAPQPVEEQTRNIYEEDTTSDSDSDSSPESHESQPAPQAGPEGGSPRRRYRMNGSGNVVRPPIRPIMPRDESLEEGVSWTDLETTAPLHIHLHCPSVSQLCVLLNRASTRRWKSLFITVDFSEPSEMSIEGLFSGREFPMLETLRIDEVVKNVWTVVEQPQPSFDHIPDTDNPWNLPNASRNNTAWQYPTIKQPARYNRWAMDEDLPDIKKPERYNRWADQPDTRKAERQNIWDLDEDPKEAAKPEPHNLWELEPYLPLTKKLESENLLDEDLEGIPNIEIEDDKGSDHQWEIVQEEDPAPADAKFISQPVHEPAAANDFSHSDHYAAPDVNEKYWTGDSDPTTVKFDIPIDPYSSLYDSIAISAISLRSVDVNADVSGVACLYGTFGQQIISLGGSSSYIRTAIPPSQEGVTFAHVYQLILQTWDQMIEPVMADLPYLRYLQVDHYPETSRIDPAAVVSASANGMLRGLPSMLLPSVMEIKLTNHSVALLSRICASGLTTITVDNFDGSCEGCLPFNYNSKGRLSHFFLDKWSCVNIDTATFNVRLGIESILDFLSKAFGLRVLTVTTPLPDLFNESAADIYLDWKMKFVTAMTQFDGSSATRLNPRGALKCCPQLDSLSVIIPGKYMDDEWGREAKKIYEERGKAGVGYMRSVLLRFDGDGRQAESGPAGSFMVG